MRKDCSLLDLRIVAETYSAVSKWKHRPQVHFDTENHLNLKSGLVERVVHLIVLPEM